MRRIILGGLVDICKGQWGVEYGGISTKGGRISSSGLNSRSMMGEWSAFGMTYGVPVNLWLTFSQTDII